MDAFLIIYCVFSYLFMFGWTASTWRHESPGYIRDRLVVVVLTLSFSPITVPFLLGLNLYDS